MTKQFINAISEALLQVNEAIRPQDFSRAGQLILKFFQKNGILGCYKMPGIEPYKNSIERGTGLRYFYNGLHSIRLNWIGTSVNSNLISSADIWFDDKNTSGGSDIHIDFGKQISLVKALPALVNVMKNPVVGTEYIFESITDQESLVESVKNVLLENSFNVNVDIAKKFVSQLEDGTKVADVAKVFGGVGYKILNRLKEMYPANFEKRGVAFFFKGKNTDIDIEAVLGTAGGTKVKVTRGPSTEAILNTTADDKLTKDGDRIVFEEQLKDLESIVKLLIKGASNSCIIYGIGGTGKTFTVEKVMADSGLTDGSGYFKVAGTASPIGVYKTLYKHRKDIVIFDDADSAFSDLESRNIFKAATDTRKIRKISWMKKTGKDFYDPDEESVEDSGDDDNIEEMRVPKYFNFEGRIIAITNAKKLDDIDKDGAFRTRSFMINIDPTALELVEYMAKLAPSIPLEDGLVLSDSERKEVVDVIRSMVGKRTGLSLRNLVRGLNIRASGISDWKNIIIRYA
jgi:hypothetical protein